MTSPAAPGRALGLRALMVGLLLGLLAVVPSHQATATEPWAQVAAAAPTNVDEEALARDRYFAPRRCGGLVLYGCRLVRAGKRAPTIVAWGDSHMYMVLPAILAAARERRVNVVAFFHGGCVPAITDPRLHRTSCGDVSRSAVRYLSKADRAGRDVRVLLGSAWGANINRIFHYPTPEYRAELKKRRAFTLEYGAALFRWLGKRGIATDVINQGPIAVPPGTTCSAGTAPFSCDIRRNRAVYKEGLVRSWLQRQISRLPARARLIDYTNAVCTPTICPAVKNGIHTWFDPYHVSKTRAAQLTRFFRPSVRRLTR